MSQTPEPSRPDQKRELPADRFLRGLGILSIALCVVGGVARVMPALRNPDESNIAAVGVFGVYLALGVGLAGLLFGLAAMLRYLDSLQAALIRVEKYQYEIGTAQAARPQADPPPDTSLGDATLPLFDQDPAIQDGSPPPSAQEPGPSTPHWTELIQVLQDIRDNSLLSDEERRSKRQHAEERDVSHASDAIRELAREGDFARIRQILDTLRSRYPQSPRVDQLVDEIESQRERFESQDITEVTRQIEDLMTIAAWQRARQLVQQLKDRHPDSAEARQLLLRVEREHKLFQDEQRRRMHAEVQRFVSRKRWEEALAAARTFIERFPGCAESEALLMQVPTLETNAQIEIRQQLEAQIMDFVKHGRYIEAVGLARKVIANFPDSPQADALRSQLARLEELANDPDAPPARVRIE
ncbi:MAG: hypothetical protein DCC65_09840 [Planctomycetota bacterium]|nr:MAG: hypothetical protein DCC65_09840 [Planctomycetota bacterium]